MKSVLVWERGLTGSSRESLSISIEMFWMRDISEGGRGDGFL